MYHERVDYLRKFWDLLSRLVYRIRQSHKLIRESALVPDNISHLRAAPPKTADLPPQALSSPTILVAPRVHAPLDTTICSTV